MTLALFAKSAPLSGARFSPCRHCGRDDCGLESDYRYELWRTWDPAGTRCVFVCLNPSTATATVDDNTIRKCVKFAKRWGHGTFVMLNIFAWRSTDPHVLPSLADPIGEENDAALVQGTRGAGVVIAAWGKHGGLRDRGREVLRSLRVGGVTPRALKLNQDGSPQHPLYIRDDTVPMVLP